MQALAHFGAAVVHLHAAVGVHMHQRAGLVEQRGREADAELDRGDGDAALEHRALCVPRSNLGLALAVAGGLLQLRQQLVQDVVFHRHLVVGDVAALAGIAPVQVGQAHVLRIAAQGPGNVAQDGLDDDDTLRPTKAAERRVALGVRLAAVRGDLHIAQVIRVVGMEHGAVGHGAGQVGAEAAVGSHLQLQARDAARVVKAHVVFVRKRVALAGDHEVFVPVQPQLDGAAQLVRGHGGPHGQVSGLGLFAAKATAQAAALHLDRMVVNAQRVRHPVLHFAGVLGAGVDPPLFLLQRQGVGDLAFQIKVLLPAHLERALQAVCRLREACGRIAPAHKHRRQHIALCLQCVLHRQHSGQGRDVELDGAHGAARLHHRIGHHQADDLAHKLHALHRKHRLVVPECGQDLVAGHVGCQHHAPHTGQGQGGAGIHTVERAMGHGGEDGRGVERALHLGQVVDVVRSARHLGAGAFVEVRLPHGSACGGGQGGVGHGMVGGRFHSTPSRWVACSCAMLAGAPPWLSSQKRCSRLPSTVRR